VPSSGSNPLAANPQTRATHCATGAFPPRPDGRPRRPAEAKSLVMPSASVGSLLHSSRRPDPWEPVSATVSQAPLPSPAAGHNQLTLGGVEETGVEHLRTVDWAFGASTKRALTHDLHPWPAKFIPDIPATVIKALGQPDSVVLDPFCGCGTTAVEAAANGLRFVATDVNPLAVLITRAKTDPPTASERKTIRCWADTLQVTGASKSWVDQAPAIPNREKWFSSESLAQLAYLRHGIRELGLATPFLEVVFSSIIVRSSRQESETRYRAVPRDSTSSDVLRDFRRRLRVALEMAAHWDGIRAPGGLGNCLVADTRDLTSVLSPGSVDLCIFSPPYPNSFDYHLYHRFRMFWLGMNPITVKKSEIGAHLRYQPASEWVNDMRLAISELASIVRPGGYMVFVVGDGVVAGEIVKSDDLLLQVAEESGFSLSLRHTRPIARHRRSFNLGDTRLREEGVLVFQR
jgi:hypothetical protein